MNTTSVNSTIPSSIYTNQYTFVNGSYFCVAWMYPIHIIFAYLVALMGIFALTTRVINPLKFLHVWCGRFFMIFMFCTMATSLMIYNTGLPVAIMVFFLFLTIGQSFGWLAIKIHAMILEKQALKIVQERIIKLASMTRKSQSEEIPLDKEQLGLANDIKKEKEFSGIGPDFNLEAEIGKTKGEILNSKGFFARFFSFKAIHGLGMTVAWWNIFGRLVVTNPFNWQGCRTYPAWKTSTGPITYVPEIRGNEFVDNVPLFVSVAFIPAFLIFIFVGFSWSFIFGCLATHKQKKQKEKELQPINSK